MSCKNNDDESGLAIFAFFLGVVLTCVIGVIIFLSLKIINGTNPGVTSAVAPPPKHKLHLDDYMHWTKDPETGCEYLYNGSLVPRIAANGVDHKGCGEPEPTRIDLLREELKNLQELESDTLELH